MMDQEISGFIREHTVATVACTSGNRPYCFNCYYAFSEEQAWLIFKSSFQTRHGEILQENREVAGTIIPEKIDVAVIRGIQFEGQVLEDSIDLSVKAAAIYYLRFPFAMAVPGNLQVISLRSLKFTDNTRGFGFKQHWSR